MQHLAKSAYLSQLVAAVYDFTHGYETVGMVSEASLAAASKVWQQVAVEGRPAAGQGYEKLREQQATALD